MTTEFERQEGKVVAEGKTVAGEARRARKRKRIEEMCDRYLLGLHCTLWGEPFEIISPRGRKEAVTWLADTLEGLAAVKEEEASGSESGSGGA